MNSKKLKILLLYLAAISGLILFLWHSHRKFDNDYSAINLSKSEALQKSLSFIELMGYSPPDGHAKQTLRVDEELSGRLQLLLGFEDARRLLDRESSIYHWEVTWDPAGNAQRNQSGPGMQQRPMTLNQRREYALSIDNHGQLSDFFVSGRVFRRQDFNLDEEIDHDTAETVARKFLKLIDFDGFNNNLVPEISHNTQRPEESHLVSWYMPLADGRIHKKISVDIIGQQVVAFRTELIIPDQDTFKTSVRSGWYTYLQYSTLAILILLIVVNLYRHLRLGHSDFSRAFWLGLIVTAGLIFSEVLNLMISDDGITFDPFRWLLALIVGLGLAMLYLSVEPLVRSQDPDKLHAFDLLLSGVVFHRKAAHSLLTGFAVGSGVLGLSVLALFILTTLDTPLILHVHDLPKMLNVNPPFLALLRGLLWRVPMLTLTFFVFIPAFLSIHEVKRTPVILLTGIIFSFAMFPLFDFHPLWFHCVFAVITGIILTAVFLWDGLVAVLVAVGVIFLSQRLPVLLHSSVDDMLISGLGGLILILLPAGIGLSAIRRAPDITKNTNYMPAYLKKITDEVTLAKELEIAREIQDILQPRIHTVGQLQFSSLFIPSEKIGGDSYDFIVLPDNRYAVVVLDVSGHGIAAALLASHLQAQIRVMFKYEHKIDVLLAELNRYMYRETPAYMFATMFLLVGSADGRFSYASAGHNPAILMRKNGRLENLEARNLALGLAGSAEYQTETARLLHGDGLFIYTDGITEAMDASGEMFGEQRLNEFLTAHAEKSDFFSLLQDELYRFSGNKPGDDITAFMISNRPQQELRQD